MWTYQILNGVILNPQGSWMGTGYAGLGEDKDQPADEAVKGQGPLPEGIYTMGTMRDDPVMGRDVIPLTPDPANEMHGRSGFYIHGDSVQHPGMASHGCIVTAHPTRISMNDSDDRTLKVMA